MMRPTQLGQRKRPARLSLLQGCLIRNSASLGPYSRTMPRALWLPGGVAVSYERGTHVLYVLGGMAFDGKGWRSPGAKGKVHRLLYHSTLGLRVIKEKQKRRRVPDAGVVLPRRSPERGCQKSIRLQDSSFQKSNASLWKRATPCSSLAWWDGGCI